VNTAKHVLLAALVFLSIAVPFVLPLFSALP
jgi:hypothetical protein